MKQLDRTCVKAIAISAMVLDHIAVGFITEGTMLYLILRTIGRITAPVMAYFVSEGYHYTRNRKRYAIRLFLTGLISSVPYSLYAADGKQFRFSVIFNLFLGFAAICLLEKRDIDIITKLSYALFIFFLSLLSDWNVFIPLWCIAFHTFRDKKKVKWGLYALISAVYASACIMEKGYIGITAAGLIVPPLILALYSEKKEQNRSEARKWFFYLFYPLHLTVLQVIKMMI